MQYISYVGKKKGNHKEIITHISLINWASFDKTEKLGSTPVFSRDHRKYHRYPHIAYAQKPLKNKSR